MERRFRAKGGRMADLYRIRDFPETFLTDKTRGRRGRLKFLQLPVKLDDLDYIEIAQSKGGAATLGVWLALLELAGTLDQRDGSFKRKDGRPMSTAEIAAVTRISHSSVKPAVAELVRVGWLISEQFGTIPNDSAKAPLEGRGGEGSREEGRGEERSSSIPSESVDVVFAHYREFHPKARPGDKERRLVRARMGDGYSVDDLKAAIDGNHASPFHCGENDRAKTYHRLDLILRDSSKVAEFVEIATEARSGRLRPHPKVQQAFRTGDNWLRFMEAQDNGQA